MSIGRWIGLCVAVAATLACTDDEPARREAIGGASAAPAAVVEDTHAVDGRDETRRGTVVFLGTSLTAGLGVDSDSAYPALIAERIERAGLPYDVVNAGSSGETSAGALGRIEWVLRNRPVDVLVLETGANDGLRGLEVAGTRANIDSILTMVRSARPRARILLVQMEAPPNLGAAYTAAFRGMYPALAERHGVELVPFLLAGVAGVDSLNQSDGIHPNEAGHRRAASTVWAVLRPVLEAEAGRG